MECGIYTSIVDSLIDWLTETLLDGTRPDGSIFLEGSGRESDLESGREKGAPEPRGKRDTETATSERRELLSYYT